MENINNKDARTARLPKGKPPTRLQKCAPATLQLDNISSSNIQSESIITKGDGFSHNAIPLLSPLVLSPSPPPLPPQPAGPESIIMSSCNNNKSQAVNTGAPVGTGGWQHPAVTGTLPEASNLFALFQSQCTLVQHSQ